MSSDESENSKGGTSTRIITQAQMRCHRARAAYFEARPFGGGEVPWGVNHELQSAVLEYYHALRPHRNDKVLKEFWQDATVWREFTGYEPVKQNGRVVDWEPQYREIQGFDKLQRYATATDTAEKEIRDAFGPRTIEESSDSLMDAQKLVQASLSLDDAAKKLGFAPEIKDEIARDEPDHSDLRGLLVDRGQVEAAEKLPATDGGEDQ